MIYKRPDRVKTRHELQVTGPWFDLDFFNSTIANHSQMALDGFDDSILKSSFVNIWTDMSIDEVRQIETFSFWGGMPRLHVFRAPPNSAYDPCHHLPASL